MNVEKLAMCHHEKEKVKERRKYRTKKIAITPLQVLESLPQLGEEEGMLLILVSRY
jgi:hypothetical protein